MKHTSKLLNLFQLCKTLSNKFFNYENIRINICMLMVYMLTNNTQVNSIMLSHSCILSFTHR